MKNIKLYMLLALGVITFSCSEDDKSTLFVQENFTSGAVLRTLDEDGALDMFDITSELSWSIQEQDREDGGLLDRVEITVTFNDRNGSDDSVSNVSLATITEFGTTDGLPSFDYSVTMADILAATGVALDQVLPGDQFIIDMELFLTDGRSFDHTSATGNVSGGSFFSSPYQYTFLVDDGIDFGIEDVNDNEISLTNPNEDYSVTITIDDANGQALVETLNVYRRFIDRSIEEGEMDLSEAEALFETFAVADLPMVDGVTSFDYVITLDDLYGENLTYDDLGLNDGFNLRYEILTSDGRVVTSSGSGTEYVDSVVVTECVQLNADTPYPGEYTVDMADSYGDGWNGGLLSVTVDGVETNGSPFRVEAGSEATATFTIPEGATTLEIVYTSGDYDDENSFDIIDPNGNVAVAEGPFPRTNGQGPFEYPVELLVCE